MTGPPFGMAAAIPMSGRSRDAVFAIPRRAKSGREHRRLRRPHDTKVMTYMSYFQGSITAVSSNGSLLFVHTLDVLSQASAENIVVDDTFDAFGSQLRFCYISKSKRYFVG